MMKKITTSILSFLVLSFFISCTSYQLTSYYDDSDGIYSSEDERGIEYDVIFKDFANQVTYSELSNSDNLPWGANPESTEIVNNFFPNFGRFYYNPFFHDSSFNPFFTSRGSFINYGFRPPFFYNSFAYELGYPFYGPMNFYFSPYATSLGNYYWYMMRYSRNYPWYNGGIYNSATAYENRYKEPSRVDFSNSASRRGEKSSSTNSSRKNGRQGGGISGLYSRDVSYGGIYIDRTGQDFDRIDTNLIGVYTRGNSNQRNINRNSSIPNLSTIKSDYVREAYRQVRSVNPSQRGNSYNYSSARARSNAYSPNQSQFNNSSTRNYSSPSRSSQGASYSSGRSGGGNVGGGGSKGSAGGSRGGGKIN